MNRTGTTTLGECLQHWGYAHASFLREEFELWREGEIEKLVRRARSFDSFEDWPWALVFRDLDVAFPQSKFILTRRSSPEVWFASLCRHADRTGPTSYREAIFGTAMPHEHRAAHIEFYERHLEDVRTYFQGRPDDLLEVCWEEGDGWAELAQFLKMPDPLTPFPHANRLAPPTA